MNRAARRADKKKPKGYNYSVMPREKPTLKENIKRVEAIRRLRFSQRNQ